MYLKQIHIFFITISRKGIHSFSIFKNNLNKKKYFFKSPLVEKVIDKNNTLETGYTTEDEFELIKFLESGSDANIFPIDKLLPFYKKIIFGIDDLLSPLATGGNVLSHGACRVNRLIDTFTPLHRRTE